MSGRFITFEGGEGSGKSTQLKLLAQAFESKGLPYIVTREPGGTTGAESIRKLLVEGDGAKWDAMTETILFMAARVDHVRKLILPALREGTHVLCDRFADSSRVYQGMARGLGLEFIDMLHDFTLGDVKPDLTLLLDIPPEQGLKRAKSRAGAETRFETLDMAFHTKVREGFLGLARAEPERIVVIDATASVDKVQEAIIRALSERLDIRL